MRLKDIRKARGFTQQQVADYIGISQNNYSYWESGKVRIDNESLIKLAQFFDVPVSLLFDNETAQISPTEVPVFAEIPANSPLNTLAPIQTIEIPANMLISGKYFGLKINDNSMYPEIKSNDIVLIKQQNFIDENNGLYVYTLGTEKAKIRKIEKSPQALTFTPINPEYPPKTYTNIELSNFSILGKVIEIRRML